MEAVRAAHNTDVATNLKLKATTLKEGARVFVLAVMVESEGVILRLNTGKLNSSLYYGDLLFPFPNNAIPPVDDFVKTIEEVVTPVKSANQANPALYNRLREKFVLTKLTPDQMDIAKAGSVLVLHKDGLVLYPSSVGIWPVNAYKDGKITLGPGSGVPETAKWDPDGTAPGVTRLTMNSGDKFWLVNMIISGEWAWSWRLYHAIKGHRYISGLFFPFSKDHPPQPEEVLKTVSEAVTVDSGDEPNAASAAAQSIAPIAPPPPPGDAAPPQPKTISDRHLPAIWSSPSLGSRRRSSTSARKRSMFIPHKK